MEIQRIIAIYRSINDPLEDESIKAYYVNNQWKLKKDFIREIQTAMISQKELIIYVGDSNTEVELRYGKNGFYLRSINNSTTNDNLYNLPLKEPPAWLKARA